jgi:Aerotolerance regulator N-terminal
MITFLSPFLIWGTLLGSIPLIIHLLNRRRFRRVDWAPMYYLKLTIQRNRRRIQLEQLLLLLLRMSLPVLLFLYLARPVLNPTGLEQWLGLGDRSSQIVLVDDSLSMGYTAGESTAFQRALQLASALLTSVRPQDRCTLLTTSAARAPVLHEVAGARREELAAGVASLVLADTHAAWPDVLARVGDVLESCTYPTRQLTVLTDLRRSGWDRSVSEAARRLSAAGARVRIVDVGADETANMSLESLLPLDRTVLAGAQSTWEAVIRNDTSRTLAGAKAILRVDDKPTEMALPDIPAHERVRVPVSVRFAASGPHDLALELPDDSLAEDNRRCAALPVKDSLLIRLVDGEPSTVPFGSEVDYVAAPLSIGVGAAEAWRVEVAQENDFLSQRLETPDVLVLANVAAPTVEQAERLERLVRAGMGLLIFTGPKLDIGLYNELLYRGSSKLLPCPLKSLSDESIRGVIVEPLHPSPLEELLELKPSALERVVVRQIMTVEEPADIEAVRVLARWNNPPRAPAVLERVVDQGRVLVWTTTADRAGNDWPVEPSFVLAVREAVRGAARPTPMTNTVTAGERMQRVVQSNQQIANVRLVPPGGGEPRPLAATPISGQPTDGAPAVEVAVPDTRRAGIYRLSWDEGPLGTQQDRFAANPDARESRLERIPQGELKSLLDPLQVEIIVPRASDSRLFAATGQEVWRDVAVSLLALLIIESVFAPWVGRAR